MNQRIREDQLADMDLQWLASTTLAEIERIDDPAQDAYEVPNHFIQRAYLLARLVQRHFNPVGVGLVDRHILEVPNVSTRLRNVMLAAGFTTLRQLSPDPVNKLFRILNAGKGTLAEAVALCWQYMLELDQSNWEGEIGAKARTLIQKLPEQREADF